MMPNNQNQRVFLKVLLIDKWADNLANIHDQVYNLRSNFVKRLVSLSIRHLNPNSYIIIKSK
jgi:hypothetical protein